MIIDAHCHAGESIHWGEHFVRQINEWFEWCGISRQPAISRGEPHDLTVSRLIEAMDEANVDKAFYLAMDMGKSSKTKVPNEYVAEHVSKYRDRLIGFASVDPLGGLKAVRELDKAVNELGLRGLKLLPAYQNLYPNDPKIFPIYEEAQELNLPTIIHTGFSPVGLLKYQSPTFIDELAPEFPKLKIIMAHCAYQWAEEAIMVMLHNINVWADISWWHAFPLENLVRTIKLAKHFKVLNKLMWGTDMFEPKADIERIRKIPEESRRLRICPGLPDITNEDIDMLLGKNAARLIGI